MQKFSRRHEKTHDDEVGAAILGCADNYLILLLQLLYARRARLERLIFLLTIGSRQ